MSKLLRLSARDNLENPRGDVFGGVGRSQSLAAFPLRDVAVHQRVLLECRVGHVGVDYAHGNPVVLQLFPGCQREAVERPLQRRVRAHVRQVHQRRAGAHVDDCSAALRAHDRDHQLHRDQRSDDVQLEETPELVGVDVLHRRVVAATGAVDEDVDATAARFHLRHHLPHLALDAHVGGDDDGARKLSRQGLQLVDRSRHQRHFRAALREQDRRGAADPDDAPVTIATLSLTSMEWMIPDRSYAIPMSFIISRLNAAKSIGQREVTRLPSTTTSLSS